jgi:hypothetical protein
MSAGDLTSRYARQSQQNIYEKSRDRIGYNDQYQSKTTNSFLDKYRPKTAIYYSALQDINNR